MKRSPDIEVLVGDSGIVVYCRSCKWMNGPFIDTRKAQAWGESKHTSCESGVLMTPASTLVTNPEGDMRDDRI